MVSSTEEGVALMSERPAIPGELCTCGRQALVVYVFEDEDKVREIGWCGLSNVSTLLPCRFCGSEVPHRSSWGDSEKCPDYQLVPAGERKG